jgi:hypothetical protein
MITFKPFTESEIMADEFLVEGEAQGVIKKAEVATSQAGNPIMKLTLSLTDCQGKTGEVVDNLVFIDSARWKVKQFCKAICFEDALRAGQIIPELINGRYLKCLIGKGKPRDNGKQYMEVKRYFEPLSVTEHKVTPPSGEFAFTQENKAFDDPIPF